MLEEYAKEGLRVMQEEGEQSDVEAAVSYISLWFAKPVTYTDYVENVTELCKLEFGNIIRAQHGFHRDFPLWYWVFGWIWFWLANNSTSVLTWETVTFPQLDSHYECLQRSEVPNFSQENFDTEYWFQKGYILAQAENLALNPVPTYFSKTSAELVLFYEQMLTHYDLPMGAAVVV